MKRTSRLSGVCTESGAANVPRPLLHGTGGIFGTYIIRNEAKNLPDTGPVKKREHPACQCIREDSPPASDSMTWTMKGIPTAMMKMKILTQR